jgi:hypothetical protein
LAIEVRGVGNNRGRHTGPLCLRRLKHKQFRRIRRKIGSGASDWSRRHEFRTLKRKH